MTVGTSDASSCIGLAEKIDTIQSKLQKIKFTKLVNEYLDKIQLKTWVQFPPGPPIIFIKRRKTKND